jgi:hypothetical protein
MATIKKKMQKGGKMTPMQSLKKKYPGADTTAKGDLRFEDLGPINRYDKKDQKKIMDTQSAFEKKYGKGKPAMKMGGKMIKKAQYGSQEERVMSRKDLYNNEKGTKAIAISPMGNAKIKSKSDDKNYVTKTKTDASGNVTSRKARRTVKGFLSGAPKLKDNLKKGGSVKKSMTKMSKKK